MQNDTIPTEPETVQSPAVCPTELGACSPRTSPDIIQSDFISPAIRIGKTLLDHNMQREVVEHFLRGNRKHLTDRLRENMINLAALGHQFTIEEWTRVLIDARKEVEA